MDKHLHIIAHEIPWPVDFGGVVDLFYKIKTLHKLGVKIHLHCFTKSRPQQDELNKYCISVDYYPRTKKFKGISFTTPYIVKSRTDERLLENLKKDDHPILFEGIHCTYLIQEGLLKDRRVFVRLHNIEYKYYRQLAKHEQNIFKKVYYFIDSILLKNYERKLVSKARFWPVSIDDTNEYKKLPGAIDVEFLPVFLPWNEMSSVTGNGTFCLYHGNLSVNENEKAADWLLNEVFADLDIPLVIAGKSPSLSLQTLAHSFPHTCIVVDPKEAEMQDMIRKAHINILPSFNNTGVKLKLLNALYNGRHCLVNSNAVEGSGMEAECSIAGDPQQFKQVLKKLFYQKFTEEEMQHRDAALKNLYDNEKNARQLISWIY